MPTLHGQPQAVNDKIPAPVEWIAFDADILQTKTDSPELVGHFYRSRDGSTRAEEHVADGSVSLGGAPIPRREIVLITNAPLGKLFTYEDETKMWSSRPRPDAKGVHRPPQYRSLSLEPMTDRIEGFELYKQVSPQQYVRQLAPALNFIALVHETPHGMRRTLSNILVRQQDPALFLPPVGAKVVEKTWFKQK